jgi:hypothetical protein
MQWDRGSDENFGGSDPGAGRGLLREEASDSERNVAESSAGTESDFFDDRVREPRGIWAAITQLTRSGR